MGKGHKTLKKGRIFVAWASFAWSLPAVLLLSLPNSAWASGGVTWQGHGCCTYTCTYPGKPASPASGCGDEYFDTQSQCLDRISLGKTLCSVYNPNITY